MRIRATPDDPRITLRHLATTETQARAIFDIAVQGNAFAVEVAFPVFGPADTEAVRGAAYNYLGKLLEDLRKIATGEGSARLGR